MTEPGDRLSSAGSSMMRVGCGLMALVFVIVPVLFASWVLVGWWFAVVMAAIVALVGVAGWRAA
jgi:hypothetical protein